MQISICFCSNCTFQLLFKINILSLFFSPLFLAHSSCFNYPRRALTDAIDDGFDIGTKAAAQNIEAIESESIVLSCGQTKMPDNDVKWFFNGKFYLIIPVFMFHFNLFLKSEIYIQFRYEHMRRYSAQPQHTKEKKNTGT